MSLINEALKKVQNQQGGTGAQTRPPGSPPTPHSPPVTQPDKGKHRSFVWGFVLAVLIIGLVTSLLATFFVWQILGTGEPVAKTDPAIVENGPAEEPLAEPVKPAAVEPEVAPAPSPESGSTSPTPAQPIVARPPAQPKEPSPIAETALATVDIPEPTSTPATEVVDTPSTASAADQTEPAVPSAEAQPPIPSAPKPPDPAVVMRLQQVQIRGIMSGGVKVLIHDEFTGRTRAYRVGEALEGTMGLVVVGITPNTIQFKDYAGSIHSKFF